MSSKQIRAATSVGLAVASFVSFALVASFAVAAVDNRSEHLPLATVAAPKPAKIGLRSTTLGKLLVDRRGFTLFAFTRDGKRRDRCATTKGCSQVWPAATTHGKPRAGRGVTASLLGTIKLAGGVKQITYAGHPLYTYSFDSSPAQTGYVGTPQFGGVWEAVKASGKLVK